MGTISLIVVFALVVALPNILESRKQSWETRSIGTLRVIVTAQQQFRILRKKLNKKKVPIFGSLSELAKVEFIDSKLAEVQEKDNYRFKLTLLEGGEKFEVVAIHTKEPDERRKFFVDQSGIITFSTQGIPNTSSEPIE